ncbi:hypothetical protein [Mycolicibacterium farcinogenes]|uniref:hypothetical protein n=1 Tax=Mycolicibacterium farcinogenes TaxID=1802 RepID=UPI0021ADB323|nr:hypothetical protein [Mycolicibacterium farcinogenes]
MPHADAQPKALIAACEQFRGAEAPGGYRDGLALCVIDSVQSTGVKYASVEKVLDRYRAYRRQQGGEPATDGTAELLASLDDGVAPTRGPAGSAPATARPPGVGS